MCFPPHSEARKPSEPDLRSVVFISVPWGRQTSHHVHGAREVGVREEWAGSSEAGTAVTLFLLYAPIKAQALSLHPSRVTLGEPLPFLSSVAWSI